MTPALSSATAVPAGAWILLGLHIVVDGVLVLLAWLATREVQPAAYEIDLGPAELPFDEPEYVPPVRAGNPIWRTLSYFLLAAVATVALGYSLMHLFGP